VNVRRRTFLVNSSCLLGLLLSCGSQIAEASTPSVVADAQIAFASGLGSPQGIAISDQGIIYVADTANNRVVTISNTGVVTPVSTPGYTLSSPGGVAVDAMGDLYIADSNNARVLKIPVSGTPVPVPVPGLGYPISLAVDATGDLYIGDGINNAIYEVYGQGRLQGTAATVSITNESNLLPEALATDAFGNLYIGDLNSNQVYKVPPAGGAAQNVTPSGYTLNSPAGLAFDAAGDLYVLDSGNTRIIEVPAANTASPYQVPVTGLASATSLAADPSGNLYVTDLENNNVTQLIYAGNSVNLGDIAVGSSGSPVAVNYELNAPETLTAFKVTMQGDPAQEASIGAGTTCKFQTYTDAPAGGNNPISPSNPFVCLANIQGAPAYPGPRNGAINLLGSSASLLLSVPFTETGTAAAAWIAPGVASAPITGLIEPQSVAISGQNGSVFIADEGSGTVYSWNGLKGTGSTLTPVPTPGITLSSPDAVALDNAGNLFIADESLDQIVVVPANTAIAPYYLATGSVLDDPIALAFDANGNLYIGDGGPAGTNATSSNPGFVVKIPAAGGPISKLNTGAETIIYPQQLTTDANGNLYIGDGGDESYDGAKVVLVPANGAAPSALNLPGPSPLSPGGLAVDPAGDVWVLNAYYDTITIVPPDGASSYELPLAASSFVDPSQMVFTAGQAGMLISDLATGNVVLVSGLQAPLTFPQTAVGAQSPSQTAAIVSIGNSALKPANPGGNLYSFGGNLEEFQVQSSSTCLSFTQLLPAQSCAFSALFAPVAPGTESESVTSIFNSYNQVQLLLAGATPNASGITASPAFSPGSGTYASAQSVSISDSASGAVIYYTLDGSTPSTSSAVYQSPILVTSPTGVPITVNAIAVASGYGGSPMASAVYNFNPYLGNNAYSTVGTSTANYIVATYAVTGNDSGGYTVNSCSFYEPAGIVTQGAKVDCGLIAAPTPGTQASSWLCHATYTNPTSSAPGGWITIPLAGCGTLAPSTAYWVATDSNDTLHFPYGYWNCGGSCNGSAPTVGNGTYYQHYLAVPYGTYTGMPTTPNPDPGEQASQYVALSPNSSLATATPTISPASGTFTSTQAVTISDATSGAVIYYTLGGSTPFSSSSVYSGTRTPSNTTTVNAIAIAPGYTESGVATATYTYSPYLGNNAYSTVGTSTANYVVATYAVTGSDSGGYSVTSCSFYEPAGTVTQGAKVDCGLIEAPTPSTQASSWLCHATYTNPTTSAPDGWITIPLTGCGTLPASTAYWIATDSNDTLHFPYGYWNCGSSCNGSAPTVGNGTYYQHYLAVPYGTYTGMPTTPNPDPGEQASQYVALSPNSSFGAATPVFSPATGTYVSDQSVTISDATAGAVIYYTLDGSTPTTSSSVYSSPLSITATTTVKAVAAASGYDNSSVATATYTFSPYLGNNAYSTVGTSTANYLVADYAVTANNADGYTVSSCSFYEPAGTVTQGAKVDCGLIAAPTPGTQASSWLCHATYTNPTSSAPGGWIMIPLAGCGTLPPNTAYWIGTDSNDTLHFPYGYWNCGGSCNGSAPTVGNGTYYQHYLAVPYGTYTGMPTTLNPDSGEQLSQYATLTAVP
jgi:sugar lactone lactonase YvrE